MRQHLGMCISLRQPEGRSLNAIVYLSTPPPHRLTLEKKLGQKKVQKYQQTVTLASPDSDTETLAFHFGKGHAVYVPRASAAAMFDLLLKRR